MNEPSNNKIIIGAGRQAAETYYFLKSVDQKCGEIAFAVDTPQPEEMFLGKQVLAIRDVLDRYKNEKVKPSVLVAIGEVSINVRLSQMFKNAGFPFFSVINKTVTNEREIVVGEGTTIAEGTVLTCNISIGNHVLINIGCTISHDCIIGNYVNISPGCHLAGRVHIEDEVFVGTGASFIPKVRIGKGSIIAAGACVTKDVPPNCMVAGVPAVIKKYL